MQQHLKNTLKTCNLSPSLHKYSNMFSPRWFEKDNLFHLLWIGASDGAWASEKKMGLSIAHKKELVLKNTCTLDMNSEYLQGNKRKSWTGCLCMYVHVSVCAYMCNYVLHMHAQISTMGTCVLCVCMCAGVYAHKQVNTNSAYHVQDSALSCGTRYSDALSHWVVTTTLET